jgi:hypothetical protein
MTKTPDNSPTFVDSELKVTASEDLDINKELASENTTNKTLDQILAENEPDDKKE